MIWLDNLRGFLALIVVLGHTLLFTNTLGDGEITYRYISAFWMPLFMFTSGYAGAYSRQNVSMLKKRLRQLMLPFVGWSLLLGVIESRSVFHYILYPTDSFWFLWALFFIILLTYVAERIAAHFMWNHNLVIIAVFLLLNIGVHFAKESQMFCLNLITLHFLYYNIGRIVRTKYEGGESRDSGRGDYLVCHSHLL